MMAKARKDLVAVLRQAAQRIAERIALLRGERVLLDADWAALYAKETQRVDGP